MIADTGDTLIRRAEQARLAGVHADTVRNWQKRGICPPPVQIGPRLTGQWRNIWVAWLQGRQAV
jgi:predicted DNA-binding transcriptional regulator AlpA